MFPNPAEAQNEDVILAVSLDADGAIFNVKYYYDEKNFETFNNIEESNKCLFQDIQQLAETLNVKTIEVLNGSMRQNPNNDFFNAVANQSCSFIHALRKITNHLQTKVNFPVYLNDILLSNINNENKEKGFVLFDNKIDKKTGLYPSQKKLEETIINETEIIKEKPAHQANKNNKQINEEIKKAQCNIINPKKPYPTKEFFLDQSKILIVYMQMHHLAAKYPNKKIHYVFYDDVDIIRYNLHKFFSEKTYLIPKNIVISTKKYVGDEPAQKKPEKFKSGYTVDDGFIKTHDFSQSIQGTGSIDFGYQFTFNKFKTIFKFNKITENPGFDEIKSALGKSKFILEINGKYQNKQFFNFVYFISDKINNKNLILYFKYIIGIYYLDENQKNKENLNNLIDFIIKKSQDDNKESEFINLLKEYKSIFEYKKRCEHLKDIYADPRYKRILEEIINHCENSTTYFDLTNYLGNLKNNPLVKGELRDQFIHALTAIGIALISSIACALLVGIIEALIGMAIGAFTGPGAFACALLGGLHGIVHGAISGWTLGIGLASAAGFAVPATTYAFFYPRVNLEPLEKLVSNKQEGPNP